MRTSIPAFSLVGNPLGISTASQSRVSLMYSLLCMCLHLRPSLGLDRVRRTVQRGTQRMPRQHRALYSTGKLADPGKDRQLAEALGSAGRWSLGDELMEGVEQRCGLR